VTERLFIVRITHGSQIVPLPAPSDQAPVTGPHEIHTLQVRFSKSGRRKLPASTVV
jgi:hypothetical protein